MSLNKNLAVAALAGLMSTAFMAPAFAADHNGATMVKAEESESAKEKNACKGQSGCATDKEATASTKEKHACKGHNSCKGQGGDGKNECKGKGSCATNGGK